jgi:hypothetical protein
LYFRLTATGSIQIWRLAYLKFLEAFFRHPLEAIEDNYAHTSNRN